MPDERLTRLFLFFAQRALIHDALSLFEHRAYRMIVETERSGNASA